MYDLAGNVVTELSATGDWNRVEIYAAGKHVATYGGGASGATYFDHVDWLGTERARTDAQGDMAETCTGLAFGDDLSCTGNDASPLHFTGKQRDSETGNDYFGARYYGSGAGRFMSSDWSSVPVAVPYADLTNPQTLNLYILVRDNPETFADLDGHCPPGQPCDPDTTNWQRPFSKTGEPHGQKPGDGQPVPQQAQQQTVNITYDKGVPAMTPATAKYVRGVLNAAGIKSAKISATTNGKHAPHSWHYKGKAVDIHVVNGTRVIFYKSNPAERAAVNAIQGAANDKRNGVARENYGPAGLYKDGRQINNPGLQRQHENHIHLTIPDPWEN